MQSLISLEASFAGICIHVVGYRWDGVLVPVHVGPSAVLGVLLRDVVVSLGGKHLGVFLLKVNLVVELVLGVGQVLNGPGVLLIGVVLLLGVVLFNLSGSLVLN